MMNSIVRPALVALAIYFAATYYLDEPDAFKSDVESIHELTETIPDAADRVVDGAKQAKERGSETVFQAKSRLDGVKERVQDSIALGAERFTGSD